MIPNKFFLIRTVPGHSNMEELVSEMLRALNIRFTRVDYGKNAEFSGRFDVAVYMLVWSEEPPDK